MMQVKVTCEIPWKTNLTNIYQLEAPKTIRAFCEQIGILWDVEAIVFINNEIAHENQLLKDQDHVLLMIPIVGG
jgi:sulfur carrier protein ThiS